ncbi:hypothetical protein WQ54_04540 [Bacillus sp. SA1-12]|uniref:hypothetical protein n=1 Tax=Bacillus sp. SA1-12 TaxID=1455638 RepID=UPI0006254391|nr:hypothetical protein [Bacillus sp. SA1-12]KKI93499.1 hypothetical protein WQ54_04540 [Bacillus sp. SA1-12]
MNENLSFINGRIAILSSLLDGKVTTAAACNVTAEDFAKICGDLKNEGLIRQVNFGNVLNVEVTEKGINYIDNSTNRIRI